MTSAEPTLSANSWIVAFEERNSRRPRVLHIGNIANNAYLNASILNAAGVDCDVLCYDYYHVMACPEWESAVFEPSSTCAMSLIRTIPPSAVARTTMF